MVNISISSKPPLLQQVLLQLLAAALLSLAFSWYQDWAWSTLVATMVGALIATSTGFYFNWRSFQSDLTASDEATPHRVVSDVYRASMVRTLMAGVLLAMAFRYGDQLDKPFLLLGFVVISLFGVVCNAFLTRDNEPQ
ncbi:MAG: ATP synthase subunit I [Pseudomonadales bacterium]|nr:ATP synthase subunit I [Pseudomonadales bacterium]